MYKIPNLVYANEKGEIFDHPELKMAVRSGPYDFIPYETELIRLPESSRLYFMPHTHPIAYDENKANMVEFREGYAVSVFLSPGFLRLFLPAYRKTRDYTMPLFAYTAVGYLDGYFVVPAIQIDNISKWDPKNYDFSCNFDKQVDEFIKNSPENRLYNQLRKCATEYHCTAAKNVFYPRWECPIPTSPACNSSCVGCISLQVSECCPSPQNRITFAPTAEEIAEVALRHGEKAKDPLVSFGQGCEGDPCLAADNIAKAVKIIKRENPNLTVNFNSNCSIPDNVAKLLDAGVDSVRVSLNSVIESTYNAYYRPRTYKFKDVVKSVELIKQAGVFLQLNLLTFPGVNDRASETSALLDFVENHKVDLIQMRNLNIDAELLLSSLQLKADEIHGIKNMMKLIKKRCPEIQFGYFNRMKKDFHIPACYPDLRPPKKGRAIFNRNMPVCIYGNKKIINTRDGSYTFYSMEYNESYKTKSVGAYTESLHKFVNGTSIIDRAREKDIRLLDICFGVGLNLAVTFDEALKSGITNRIHAVSVEKDAALINIVKNTHILMPANGYKVVRSLLDIKLVDNFSMELYIQDAVDFIYSLNHKFDVIYFDPFSKKHNSEMWSDNMFCKLHSLLETGGVLTTYASGKSIKESLVNAGFSISSLVSLGARYQPATKAVKY